MRIPSSNTVLLCILLFLATALALWAGEPAPAAGSADAGFLQSHAAKLWIPIAVPILLAGLKTVWPRIPRVALPYLCPALGFALAYVGPAIGQNNDPGLAAALGAVGNWLREAVDQARKATAPPLSVFAVGGACLLAAGPAQAADTFLDRVNVGSFVSYRVHEFGRFNGKFGGGVAFGYELNKQVTLEAETILERFDDSHFGDSFTEAGANLKLALIKPRADRPLIPYALIGYTRDLDNDSNRMNAGAGLDLRLARRLSVFLDGRWTHDFETLGHALFRSGLNLSF